MEALESVLVIEDDKMIRELLRLTLEKKFLILEASTARRSWEILTQHHADAIVMDLNLPDFCGLQLIKNIRKNHAHIPIIVLSGEKDDARKVQCFNVGADDFVEKPFCTDLLVARINAHLKRCKELNGHSNIEANDSLPSDSEQQMELNGWVVDPLKFQLFDKQGHSADLSSREFCLLQYFLMNEGRAISRQELCEAVREKNYVPTPRALDVKIARIRKKICGPKGGAQIIKTIRGVGYMLNLEN